MGQTAENLHDVFPQLTREDADRYALRSQQRAAAAWDDAGRRLRAHGRADERLRRARAGRSPTATSSCGRTRRSKGSRACARRSAPAAASPPATPPVSPTAPRPACWQRRRRRAELGLRGAHAPRRLRVRGRRAAPDGARAGPRHEAGARARRPLELDDIGLFELNEPFAVQVLTWCDGARRRPGRPAPQPVRRRDRLRAPAGGDGRAADGAAGLRLRAAARTCATG